MEYQERRDKINAAVKEANAAFKPTNYHTNNNNKPMNTYSKFVPNVFLAKCEEKHEKGDIITMTTKYGQEHECEVYNLIYERGGFYFYSIVRADGFNAQERAKRKAERLLGYADNAEKRGEEYRSRSDKGKDFLVLAEPIKIGHHSEKRHRKLIEDNHRNFGKYIDETKKAETYESRAAYWEKRAKDINLSMPESIEFFEHKLEEAKRIHAGMKAGTIPRAHSMSLQYANKNRKEAEEKYKLALRLWS